MRRRDFIAGASALALPATARGNGCRGAQPLPTPQATGNQIVVNSSRPLSTPLPAAMWGQSMENNGPGQALWTGTHPTAQAMNMPMIRVLWKRGDPGGMATMFPNATSTGSFSDFDVQLTWIKNHAPPGFLFKLDPEVPTWCLDSNNNLVAGSSEQLQAQYQALAAHAESRGVHFTYWEGPGEWPGSPAVSGQITDIMQAGVHQVDPTYKISGPGQDYLNHSTSDLNNGYLVTGLTLSSGSWDEYWGGATDLASQQTALTNMIANCSGNPNDGVGLLRATMNAKGFSNAVLISTEFNQDSDDSGVNGYQGNIVYCAAHISALVNSGCNVAAAAYWHMHNYMLNASDWSLYPMAYYYKQAVATMPGFLVDKSIGSSVPSTVLHMPSRQGASGSPNAVHLVNTDLSNPANISLRLVGYAAGNLSMWQSNGSAPSGSSSSVTQASLSNLTLPASSVTIISGEVASSRVGSPAPHRSAGMSESVGTRAARRVISRRTPGPTPPCRMRARGAS